MLFLLPLSLRVAMPLDAQQRPPLPAESTLVGIEARGLALYRYDQAAWHATDAVLALHPADGLVTSYVVLQAGSEWTVSFGRISPDSTAFLVAFEAHAADSSRVFEAAAVVPARPDTGVLLRAARAIGLARNDLGSTPRQYNVAALPVTDGSWWVYVYPAPTTGIWPLGGDTRYRISADGRSVLERHRMHRAIIDFRSPAPGDSVKYGYHTAVLDDIPEDSDVFFVLEREPPLPEYVFSRVFACRITTDGRITCFYRTTH